ncbi:MAG: phosphoribosyl-AMP cyclohydrolase [Armatimonadota bacterium]|nr:phosphoribosyl-AMP cyclohydrolase [Armatimonadota bacterium]
MYTDDLEFNDQGLIPAVVCDHETSEVLMVAYMNEDALRQTIETGKATYWSRSRQKMWVKGETSGNTQRVNWIRLDCDGDTLLLGVEQTGGACHLGYRSCFYRELHDGEWEAIAEKVFDPDEAYGDD